MGFPDLFGVVSKGIATWPEASLPLQSEYASGLW